jgi:UDP-GlcNAc:undecaprenyl-phosphate GlcNAc-1-phosphate transferase
MYYLLPFLLALIISLVITPLVRRVALHYGIIDRPDFQRKVHKYPVAYLGGVAIFAGFLIPVLAFLPLSRRLWALLIAIALLLVVGVVDDIKGLSPWIKLGWQVFAALIVLCGGIGIVSITNPFGNTIILDWGRFAINFGSLHFHITPVGNLLSVLWMVGMINIINFIDGLDGLACGVSSIAALVIFLLSISPKVGQPQVALLAIILTGAAVGFLPYNFFPAKIFMGDGGAYFLGLTLALLAIYSGGKLATAGLVLGFTIFDGVWAAIRRLMQGKSPFKADKNHFHHLLLDVGLSQRQAVLILYAIASLFGLIALGSSTTMKLVSLLVLLLVMAASTAILTLLATQARKRRASLS